jgi:NAD(P)-dependent dehydrogenase (short-subunit alcohol dehydrogenase family)
MTACFGVSNGSALAIARALQHSAIVHPGFTNTPMVRVLGEGCIKKNILPYTRLGRLIEPSEIAETICFLMGLFAQPLEKVKVYPTSTNRCCHPLPAKLC